LSVEKYKGLWKNPLDEDSRVCEQPAHEAKHSNHSGDATDFTDHAFTSSVFIIDV
jgi:hypothetical protein